MVPHVTSDPDRPRREAPDCVLSSMLKTEVHDLRDGMHRTDAGAFPVEEYRRSDHGLYVRRRFQGHPKIQSWEAHVLPRRHVQICRYRPHEGRWWCEYYIDVVEAEDRGTEFRVKDLILDVAIGHESQVHILDTGELIEAIQGGTITASDAATALTVTHALINELSQNRNDLVSLLARDGITLTWHSPEPG